MGTSSRTGRRRNTHRPSRQVGVAVHQNDDMLEGHARQEVVEAVDVLCHQIAVGIERVVVGACRGAAPAAFVGHRRAALQRLCRDGDDVEAALERRERLMGEEGVGHTLAVTVELAHLFAGVALGHDGQIDASGDVGLFASASLPDLVIGDAVLGDGTDEDVGRVDGMREGGHRLAVEVGERDGDVDGFPRHGHVIARLECLFYTCGLLGCLPFLEEGREGVHEEQAVGVVVAHADLSVAAQGHVGEPCPSSCPLRRGVGLLKEDVLCVVGACKDIVEAQVTTVEDLVEDLCSSW